MHTADKIILVAGLSIQGLLIIAGLRFNNLKLCYSFFVYLVAGFLSSIAVSQLAIGSDAQRSFYAVKELILAAIKVSMLLELNTRMFRWYPRIHRSNSALFGAAALFLLLYVWLVPPEHSTWWGTLPLDLQSKIMQVTCLVLLVFAARVLLYRLHVDYRHKYMILGFLFSQFPLALGFAVAASLGPSFRRPVGYVNSVFFILALLIWARVYWPPYVEAHHSLGPPHPRLDSPADSGSAQ